MSTTSSAPQDFPAWHVEKSFFVQGLIQLLAGSTLAVAIWLNSIIWPIGFLGYTADLRNGTVIAVTPRTPAAVAGLQVGDRIINIYGQPWSEVVVSWNALVFVPPVGSPIEMQIDRAGSLSIITLKHTTPDASFQVVKAVNLLLAGLCWLVGYVLGMVRRGQTSSPPIVAAFWLAMGGLLALYPFASFASVPLQVLLRWLAIALLAPASVYLHLWFPARPVAPPTLKRVRRLVVGWAVGSSAVLAGVIVLWRPSLTELLFTLSDIQIVVWFAAFVTSGSILFRAYHRAQVAHIRRQVRLIALACLVAGCGWAFAFTLPLLLHAPALLSDQRFNIVAAGIPLAYLVGGIGRDLYRVDRALLRLVSHVLATLVVFSGLALVVAVFGRDNSLRLWTVVIAVVLYGPAHRIVRRLLTTAGRPERDYGILQTTLTQLSTTLDAQLLSVHLGDGIRAAFGEPALGVYLGEINGSNRLRRVTQERMSSLPLTIEPGQLTTFLSQQRAVLDSRRLLVSVDTERLQADEEHALRTPGIVLWCPIVHRDGYLLGLIVLGPRGDFDLYRDEDRRELQRLLGAAALAFANSAAYARQLEAEETIRELYQHLQEVQDETATELARELHDEIINVNVRLNVQAIERLRQQTSDPAVHAEIDLLLESERTVIQTLRLICEQLHPTGLDDPYGLASVLRLQIDRLQSQWNGICRLHVKGEALPVSARVQREAMRVVREAVTNAMKHANAQQIAVELCYPETMTEPIKLIIWDDGQTAMPVVPRQGHWGIRNMYESARMVGGELSISVRAGGGTVIRFCFGADGVEYRPSPA